MSDDLVTEARKGGPCAELGDRCRAIEAASGCFCAAVADRIEALTAERDDWKKRHFKMRDERDKQAIAAKNYADFNHEWRKRAEKAEAERNEALNQLDSERHSVEVLEKRVAKFMADNARLRAIVSGMKAYLAGEPSNPPATGVKKVDLVALNTGKEPT